MFAQRVPRGSPGPRRGVVLILILGMLGLLALIGVTFATFSGQAQVGARYFEQGMSNPDPEQYLDWALSQLINDTNNAASAIRGHSLKRDMYGGDAPRNVYIKFLPYPVGQPPMVTGMTAPTQNNVLLISTNVPANNYPQIAVLPQFYNTNFVGCILRLEQWLVDANTYYPIQQIQRPDAIPQTFEIVSDDNTGSTHVLGLSQSDNRTFGLLSPASAAPNGLNPPSGTSVALVFTIDGRYLRAFNGSGAGDLSPNAYVPSTTFNATQPVYPNFLYNQQTAGFDASMNLTFTNPSGLNDPNALPYQALDEDYDAPDNENWFLALQSADGQVVLPSFHRPGNIVYDPTNPNTIGSNDWKLLTTQARAKFLRPRKIDHPMSGDSFPDLLPDATTGQIKYDVDNDGDGITDAVWLDLGYPPQRDANGRQYKPLFAFTVLGLNGRLPMNTAGNIHGRDGNGAINASHVSHLGYSPNEVNPTYAMIPSTGSGPGNGTPYLQIMLQGNATVQPPIDGRFGEADVIRATAGNTFPRAGRSSYFKPNANNTQVNYTKVDEFDSDYTGYDFYPNGTDANGNALYPELSDYYDAAGRTLLPVERIRRFVTPIDPTGNGRVLEFGHGLPLGGTTDFGNGFDDLGRVGFFMYYRPPGLPNSPGDLPSKTRLWTNAVNKLHGYEAFRNPSVKTGTHPGEFFARMPFDVGDGLTSLPTFDGAINSTDPGTGTVTNGMYPNNSLALDEAAQLNLYEKTTYDSPFGVADQEWLSRAQDEDGASLSSRLSSLLPDVLVNDHNALMHRRFFSTDSWELNTFSAPNMAGTTFYGLPQVVGGAPYPQASSGFPDTAYQASLTHGNKKFNLNLPLPVSNSSNEPVRLKYVRELYELMKLVLYPPTTLTGSPGDNATATQLAALGQFAVNVVDFRDPDATMTKFVNYDLAASAPQTSSVANTSPGIGGSGSGSTTVITRPAGVTKAASGSGNLVQWGMEYNPISITEVLAYQYTVRDTNNNAVAQKRMFVELVNTLTQDYPNPGVGAMPPGPGTACDLDLNGWGFIITQDNPLLPSGTTTLPQPTDTTTARVERPNIVTGQLDPATISGFFVPISGGGLGPAATPTSLPTSDWIKAQRNGDSRNNFETLVLANTLPYANTETGPPTVATTPLADVLVNQIPTTPVPSTSGKADYYWLHLVRPANPNSASMGTADRVVVDSFRFPFITNNDKADVSDKNNTSLVQQGTLPLYSVRRLQPYRGAHYVPYADTWSPSRPYGYTEQTVPTINTSNSTLVPKFNGTKNGAPDLNNVNNNSNKNDTSNNAPTYEVYHNLGKAGTNPNPDNWDHFSFNDRDFMSPAELLLVPACPPGLFTKLFAEQPNPAPATSPTGDLPTPTAGGTTPYYTPPPAMASQPPDAVTYANNKVGIRNLPDPCVFPYLADAFHYSSGSKSSWYQLLEYVEVPTPSLGYIGPVAAGQNADWARKDIRPGLINLNLIIDEEVFYGLVDDPRLSSSQAFNATTVSLYNLPAPTASNSNPVGIAGIPRMATALYPNGMPSYTVPVSDVNTYAFGRGFPQTYTVTNSDGTTSTYTVSAMKSAFADFLKLRDGGSGLVLSPYAASMYLWGDPSNPNYPFTMPSKPFRSLAQGQPRRLGVAAAPGSISDTVMRPARLGAAQIQSGNLDQSIYQFTSAGTPAIPPRMLFEIPDNDGPNPNPSFHSPAGELGGNVSAGNHIFLNNTNADLFDPTLGLGAASTDRRAHPYWRTEILSKVMNLSTVRTHQYAVWLTVGFFEVVQAGNPQLAAQTDINGMSLAVDRLGRELDADIGKNVRYRSYFLIDRTRATGFNPYEPDDFRDLVVFRRRIE